MKISTMKFARRLCVSVACVIAPISLRAQITVNSASDVVDANDGLCTLREAITSANTDLASGMGSGECAAGSVADTISFNIGGGGSAQTIQPTSGLPFITESLLIDGPSQGCSSGPCIELDGTSAGIGKSGIVITSSGSTIRGLAINRFSSNGVSISGSDATDNTVEGSHIGTNLDGDAALPNNVGVGISVGATNNLIGGTTDAARNVISGNGIDGVIIFGAGVSQNRVQGNFIGVDITGTIAIPNQGGVDIRNDATDNLIGGTEAGAGNVISGNTSSGIVFSNSGTAGNRVEGNLIGTNLTGTGSIPNRDGIFLFGGANKNIIGGTTAGTRNVISGNTDEGIHLQGTGTDSNRVEGNYIGLEITGTSALANGGNGIELLFAASGNWIGGSAAGAGNVISGNGSFGISLRSGTNNNRVEGNVIGANASATSAVANGSTGISIDSGASDNFIGGAMSGAGNVISGNSLAGIQLVNAGTSGNTIQGNLIGTNGTGTGALANSEGIRITFSADSNAVGGTTAGSGNTIAFNTNDGVVLTSNSGNKNSILGNSIFSNGGQGIDLGEDGATANDAGDADAGPNNLQNFPDLTSAELSGSSLTLVYSVDSDTMHAGYSLRVEFFKADSDAEEGKRYLGFDAYSEGEWSVCGTGNEPCSNTATIAVSGLAIGDTLVATATDFLDNSSEFSASIIVAEGVFSGASLYARAFLEGPYNSSNDNMNTGLFDGGVLPLSQPFSGTEFNGTVLDFDSTQTVTSHADSTVDWLLVSLRTGTGAGTELVGTQHAAVIFEGGTVVSPDDDSLRFAGIADGSYYLVLRSRNHLDIMSDSAIVVSGGVGMHDFTPAATAAYPGNDASAQKELETGVFGMFAGDGTVDGQVTASDFNLWLVDTKAVATGYLLSDYDLDAQVTASDFNLWLVNTKAVATSKVP